MTDCIQDPRSRPSRALHSLRRRSSYSNESSARRWRATALIRNQLPQYHGDDGHDDHHPRRFAEEPEHFHRVPASVRGPEASKERPVGRGGLGAGGVGRHRLESANPGRRDGRVPGASRRRELRSRSRSTSAVRETTTTSSRWAAPSKPGGMPTSASVRPRAKMRRTAKPFSSETCRCPIV